MHKTSCRQAGALALALGLALAGCKGSTGDQGPQGPQGGPGNDGSPGSSVGSITGTLKDSGGVGFAGAVVTTTPLSLASAATGADGVFTIPNVPIGTYALAITKSGIATVNVANVVVVANTATNVGTQTVVYSPIAITLPTFADPVGFNVAVPLSATVTGATGTLTYTWSITSGPTTDAAAFSDVHAAAPTFTPATLQAMIAAGKLRNLGDRPDSAPPTRNGLLAFTTQQVTNSTYTVKLAVTDGTYTQSKTVSIPTAAVAAGQNAAGTAYVPTKVNVLANTGTVDAAGWTLTAPGTSTATLHDATTKNPWFVPDVPGTYVLKNGAATVSTITASDWKGSVYDAPTANCGASSCHSTGGATDLAVKAKFKDWSNSAHGNHFFKFFEYSGDTLVVKGNPTATSVVVPTATAGVNWTLTAPFRPITTFEFGATGGEGSHYSESCMRCHTVGMNKAPSIVNGGIDDVAGYAFPTISSTDATPAPVTANWTSLAQAAKDRAGMQCESCHGPLNRHNNLATAPKAFFDAGTCGVCHDSGSNHNRFNLWAQSGHANLTLAEEEGTSTNCGRCHSAQGFVEWSKNGFAPGYTLAAAPAVADVEPQTCVACHDPHTTGLRVDESVAITTTSGFTVSGAGPGQLCVICHSSRRGLHNDTIVNTSYSLPHSAAQSDLFFGQNAYFFGALADGATVSTHAYVLEGTCAGCHMDPGLSFEGLNMVPTVTNHSFKVSADVCAKCHATSFSALEERIAAGIADLNVEISNAAQRSIPSTAGFKATLPNPAGQTCSLVATFTGVARPTSVVVGMPPAAGHGTGFTFAWTSDVTYTILAADNATVDCDPVTAGVQPIAADIGPVTLPANTGQAVVLDAKLTALDGTTVLVPANGDLFKAWWNMSLVQGENSFGAHNPSFAQRMLSVSKTKVKAIGFAP